MGSEQRNQRPDTHSHGKVQNAGKVPGHEALARRKTRSTQESSQHQGSSYTDRHIAEPGRPGEDSRQDSVEVQSQKPKSGPSPRLHPHNDAKVSGKNKLPEWPDGPISKDKQAEGSQEADQ